jgi:hypothetical protein
LLTSIAIKGKETLHMLIIIQSQPFLSLCLSWKLFCIATFPAVTVAKSIWHCFTILFLTVSDVFQIRFGNSMLNFKRGLQNDRFLVLGMKNDNSSYIS